MFGQMQMINLKLGSIYYFLYFAKSIFESGEAGCCSFLGLYGAQHVLLHLKHSQNINIFDDGMVVKSVERIQRDFSGCDIVLIAPFVHPSYCLIKV